MKLDQITFYPVEDKTTMMNLYKAGEVDALYNHTSRRMGRSTCG